MKKLKVELISYTNDPIGTVVKLWRHSRGETDDIDRLNEFVIFKKIFNSQIPICENVSFVFLLKNVSIALREQMVRHRIGIKAGPELGIGFIPDLTYSTWWSETMRVKDMSKFSYHIPNSIKVHTGGKSNGLVGTAQKIYEHAMVQLRDTYSILCKIGIPPEDAREVLPLATLHDISWTLNLVAIQHIMKKRTCWITQMGIWEPVIVGMINELSKVHPVFRTLANPPCINTVTNKFDSCPYGIENEARVEGKDPYAACPLYVNCTKHTHPQIEIDAHEAMHATNANVEREELYRNLWNRRLDTGEAYEAGRR